MTDTNKAQRYAARAQIGREMIRRKLSALIIEREIELERGRSQSDDVRAMKCRIDAYLNQLGLEYNTLNMARLGSPRALNYVARGLVDGYTVKNGRVVESSGI